MAPSPRPRRKSPRTGAAADDGRSTRRRPTPDAEGPRTKKVADTDTPRPRKTRKKEEKRKRYTIIDFFCDYRVHMATGLILMVIAIVMAVCCMSFIFSMDADQSVIHGHSAGEIVAAGDTVNNAGGAVGAKLAEWLMVKSWGIGSFILALWVLCVGLATAHLHKIKFFTFTFRCFFATVAVSVIAGLLTFNTDSSFNIGGDHGYYVNYLLLKYSDALGAYSVSVILLILLVAIFWYPIKTFAAMLTGVFHRKTVAKTETGEVVDAETGEILTSPLDAMEEVAADFFDEDTTYDNEHAEDPAAEDSTADSDIPAEHERYLPKAALSVFDDTDETVSDVSDEPTDTDVSSIPDLTEATDISGNTENTSTGDPELVIITKNDDETPQDAPYHISNGDHVSLDQPYDIHAEHSHYQFPPLDLLVERNEEVEYNAAEQQANKKLIVDALRSYNIEIMRIEATIGPTVTLYEIVPAQGIRIAKIKSLEDDIAMNLSAPGIRIIAPMPGKGTVGIEVPNRKPQVVSMRKILESKTFTNTSMTLPMALGRTITGDIYMADMAKLPHLLVAGATGQGKSVGLNCIITSLLYAKHPDELKFVLIDPKTVEFALFETISRQYLAKLPDEENAVITDPQKVLATLYSLCVEMENRYALLKEARVRDIKSYNEKFVERRLNPEEGHFYMPYIVVVVDEYADLVMVAGKEVHIPVCRITQKARAVGIHMILATQRPSTDVITGMIKNNFTSRIAFKVTQSVDSKTIIDGPGAQRLIGRGDMLTMMNGKLERVQCAFVDTPEVEAICDHIGSQQGFVQCYQLPEPPIEDGKESDGSADIGTVTEEFKRCAMFISTQSQASITMLQRKFEIGFNKAGRFMDQMQQMGIVGPARGAKPRDVLMTPDDVQRLFE